MHLLSSPAHLFSMILLSIVLGVMTMAVPLTVRDTDIGKLQWHPERRVIKVNLVRRYGQEQPPPKEDTGKAVCTQNLDSREHWYLYITSAHGFYAVQEDRLWRLRKVDNGKKITSGLNLGTIQFNQDFDPNKAANRVPLMENLYSKIETITDSTQFTALNATIDFLKTNIPEGLTYTPNPKDPDAWTKIFLAMTDYDQYRQIFPSVAPKDRYEKIPEGTTEAQRAGIIKHGLTTFTSSSQPDESQEPSRRPGEGLKKSSSQPGVKSKEQGDDGSQTQLSDPRMKISNLL
ncbi:hypothetical protein DFH05DRAFT_1465023, partial [Lentinula detonsa]